MRGEAFGNPSGVPSNVQGLLRLTGGLVCCLLGTMAMAADWVPTLGSENDLQLTQTDQGYQLQTTGQDPFLVGDWQQPPDPQETILECEYFCPDGVDHVMIYWGKPFTATKKASLPPMPIAETWRSYRVDLRQYLSRPAERLAEGLRIDLGNDAGIRLQLRNVRLRRPNAAEATAWQRREQQKREQRERAAKIDRLTKRQTPEGHAVDRIEVGPRRVVIAGKLPSEQVPSSTGSQATAQRWRLVEFPPHVAIDQQPLESEVELPADGGRFTVTVPRMLDHRDRLFSAWQLRRERRSSARKYPTSIAVADGVQAPTDRLRPRSQKGLGGFDPRAPLAELDALGIDAITINLVLPSFLSSRPVAGEEPLAVPGEPVFFQPAGFARYDRLMAAAAERDIVVSAIVLIPRVERPGAASPLQHPEADGGVYTMPDLTTARGAAIYGQVLKRIARRYHGGPGSAGRISNWIAHNEVDFHSVWTNMGPHPAPIVMETYYRSMRMIAAAARTANPHARVFASLTHHWATPRQPDPTRLVSRDLLRCLQALSRQEGDFPWGVAYHPYPESLFAEVAWRDKRVEDGFDSPLVTMQNLEVLPHFLRQPDMRDATGSPRPILLSEQGFHSASDAPEDQAKQAGSLAWAMRRLREIPEVESFHYHRWADHPREGGLKLGLRTLPEPDHPWGREKRAWEVYRAIGTPREGEVCRDLPRPPDGS